MKTVDTTLRLTVDKILIYYDLPQLFIAKDQVDSKYICLNVESEGDFPVYISIRVSQNKLNELILGKMDLRTAFQNSETGIWYFVTFNESGNYITQPVNFEVVDEKYLPDADFFFPIIEQSDETIVRETTEKSNSIVHLSFVDNQNAHAMDIELLGDFMKLFQNLVKYSYKKAVASQIKSRPDLAPEKNYILKAFAVSPGSFNVHLESQANKDIFGNSNVEYALRIIDQIMGDISNKEVLLEKMKMGQGHAINAYKKILENIRDNNIDISYKWTSAATNEVTKRKLNKIYAEKVIELISSKVDLGSEVKEFIGIVTEVDYDKGTWRIIDEGDNKAYSGVSKNSLEGITIHSKKYKFVCDEIVEMIKISQKEKVSYNLLLFSTIE
jgi:hypothetical protein